MDGGKMSLPASTIQQLREELPKTEACCSLPEIILLAERIIELEKEKAALLRRVESFEADIVNSRRNY